MKQIPILFSTPMVKAILAGRKTMTRRIVKPQPTFDTFLLADIWRPSKGKIVSASHHFNQKIEEKMLPFCRYGQPGDILWVRESFTPMIRGELTDKGYEEYIVFEDGTEKQLDHNYDSYHKRPCIHMPKAAARIWLEVTDIRAEHLRDITEEDAKAEGVLLHERGEKWLNYIDQKNGLTQFIYNCRTAKESCKTLWDLINGSNGWHANPWVWVVSFKVLSTTGKPEFLVTDAGAFAE